MAKNHNGMDTSLMKILDGGAEIIATDPRNGSDDNILLNNGSAKKSMDSSNSQPISGHLDINGSLKSINPDKKSRGTGDSSTSSNESNEKQTEEQKKQQEEAKKLTEKELKKQQSRTLKKNLQKAGLDKSAPKEKKNISAKKLSDKTAKLRKGDVDETDKLKRRYYHISTDKLGDAFEKQFMANLPDFGQFTQTDVENNPKSAEQRSKEYGLKNQKAKVGVNQPLIKPKQFGKPSNNLFTQSEKVKDTKTDEVQKSKEAIQEILQVDDIYSISIFKSRVKFRGLQATIRGGEANILNYNYIWLVGFGIIMLLIAVVSAARQGTPLAVFIALAISQPQVDLDKVLDLKNPSGGSTIRDDMRTWGLLVQLFCALKAVIFTLWHFYANGITKQRKVKEMYKLAKYFKGAVALYVFFMVCALAMQIVWVVKLVDDPSFVTYFDELNPGNSSRGSYRTTAIIKVVVIFVVYLFSLGAISGCYWILMDRYTASMEGFHLFLTTYRQTPRSRFIRKYQPNLEPLYEENSIFERSMVTTGPGNDSRVIGANDSRVGHSRADLTSIYNNTFRQSLANGGLSQMINFDEETQLFIEEFDTAGGAHLDSEGNEQPADGMILDKLFTQSFSQEKDGEIHETFQGKIQVNQSQDLILTKGKGASLIGPGGGSMLGVKKSPNNVAGRPYGSAASGRLLAGAALGRQNPLEDSELNRVENNVKILGASDFQGAGYRSGMTDANTANFGHSGVDAQPAEDGRGRLSSDLHVLGARGQIDHSA